MFSYTVLYHYKRWTTLLTTLHLQQLIAHHSFKTATYLHLGTAKRVWTISIGRESFISPHSASAGFSDQYDSHRSASDGDAHALFFPKKPVINWITPQNWTTSDVLTAAQKMGKFQPGKIQTFSHSLVVIYTSLWSNLVLMARRLSHYNKGTPL